MPEEKLYKVTESWLIKLADTIRYQKKSERKYILDDMLKTLRAMLVLPSGLAEIEVDIKTNTDANGMLPTIYKGSANCNVDSIVISTCTGIIPNYVVGTANSVANITVATNATGTITS